MLARETKQQTVTLVISTIVLGLVVGLSSLFLGQLLDVVERLFLHFEENAAVPVPTETTAVNRLVSVTLGGLIVAIIWYTLKRYAQSTVSIKQALQGEKMPFAATAVHVMTQIFYVGTGGSIGRELAPREAGAMLAQQWQMIMKRVGLAKLSTDDQRLLIAAAAGAGFAGIYIAPITGMLFAVEILLKKVDMKSVAVSLSMSVIAMLIGSISKGFVPYYLVAKKDFTLNMLPFVLVVGLLMGVLGAYFRRGFQWAGKHSALSSQILWQLPLAALITGLVAMFMPEIMGNGRGLAEFAFVNTDYHLALFLLVGALLKAVVTIMTIKGGASGGTLTPSIAIGSSLGVLIGFVYVLLVPGASLVQAGVIGAAGFLAASQQAPLMALFMLFEVCHLDYSALLPMGLSVALASASSKWILK
ncbi:MAG TPA: chloride channel protein [Weissella thailandensis]|uniref:chloride channel protein n=1 Tax=Weissella thailandensis TaxID=89061 RepID=UPI001DD2FFEB|nr:chloride channel protein [Weissella thailandensis]HJG84820.1 chloride channel protein [Weissella thailandensis]